jgi:hypothetical protein
MQVAAGVVPPLQLAMEEQEVMEEIAIIPEAQEEAELAMVVVEQQPIIVLVLMRE